MGRMIYYLIDLQNKEIFAFNNHDKAKTKEKELGLIESDFKDKMLIPRCSLEFKTLKNYYGTIWIKYRFNESGSCAFKIEGRMKDLGIIEGFKVKKIALEPYEKKRGEVSGDLNLTPPTALP